MFLCAYPTVSAFFLPVINVIPAHLDKFHVLCAYFTVSAFFLPVINVIPAHLDKFHVLCAYLTVSAFFLPGGITGIINMNGGFKSIEVDVINELLSKLQRHIILFQIELNLSDNSHSYLIVMLSLSVSCFMRLPYG
jgi:uncharacterized protein YozE (UPF0346 family)